MKSKIEKIGIVGLGFVGSAIRQAFNDQYHELELELVLVDTDPTKGTHTYKDLMDCEGVFVCVPTPFGDDGICDTRILENVLSHLKNFTGVIISKCTAPPHVYQRLNEQYLNLVHAPEFLTAANANKDYKNGKFAIIGGQVGAYQREAERIINLSQRQLEDVTFCSIQEASMTKYAINSFLATKVIFMNELHKLAEQAGQDYEVIAAMMQLDTRIGHSHMRVPGPDGEFGFGGMCFPKDTAALLKYAEEQGVQMSIVDAAVRKNVVLKLTQPK
jgi:UDPglucose 6-dehydrogenase